MLAQLNDSGNIRILVAGQIGTGKSALCNLLYGVDNMFETGNKLSSVTTTTQEESFITKINDKNVNFLILDTPGSFINEIIKKFSMYTYDIYLIVIPLERISISTGEIVELLLKSFNGFDKSFIVFTHAENETEKNILDQLEKFKNNDQASNKLWTLTNKVKGSVIAVENVKITKEKKNLLRQQILEKFVNFKIKQFKGVHINPIILEEKLVGEPLQFFLWYRYTGYAILAIFLYYCYQSFNSKEKFTMPQSYTTPISYPNPNPEKKFTSPFTYILNIPFLKYLFWELGW